MTGRVYDHIGIVVPDIRAAAQRFAEALRIQFGTVSLVHVEGWEPAGSPAEAFDLRVAYSVDGPPYFELIEQAGSGVFGQAEIGRIHHVGYRTPDVEQRLAELIAAGLQVEATQRKPPREGPLSVVYMRPSGLYGARVELLRSQT